MWLGLTKRNDATFRVIDIIPLFDTVTVTYIPVNVSEKDGCNTSKEMSSANEGEGMRYPLIKIAHFVVH